MARDRFGRVCATPQRRIVVVLCVLASAAISGCAGAGQVPDGVNEPTLVAVEFPDEDQFVVLDPFAGVLVVIVGDSEDAAVDGVVVTVVNANGEVIRQVHGSDVLTDLPAGRYDVRVTAPGYLATERTFRVPAGIVTTATITLRPGDAAQTSGTATAAWADARQPQTIVWLLTIPIAAALLAGLAMHPSVRLRRARRHLVRGRPEPAERLTKKVLAWQPTKHEALFLHGAALLRQGRPEETVRLLESSSARIDPAVAGLAFLITLAHQDLNQPERARRWLALVARDHDYWEALTNNPTTALDAILEGRTLETPAYA